MGSVVRQDFGEVANRKGFSFHRSRRQVAQLEAALGGQLTAEAKGQTSQESRRETDTQSGREGCLINNYSYRKNHYQVGQLSVINKGEG